jgi:hypothetical protein
MLNAVEFTTTESEFLIRLDRSSVNAAILEQITEYVHQLVKPLPPQNWDRTGQHHPYMNFGRCPN